MGLLPTVQRSRAADILAWFYKLSTLIIWAYEQALSPVKSRIDSRPRSQDGDSRGSSTEQSHSGGGGILQAPASREPLRPLAKRVPLESTSMDKATREASLYLSYISTTSPQDEEAFHPPHHCSTAVLELVEKECRGSRWELGREASGACEEAHQRLHGADTFLHSRRSS